MKRFRDPRHSTIKSSIKRSCTLSVVVYTPTYCLVHTQKPQFGINAVSFQLEKMLDNDNTQLENEHKLVIIGGQITFKPQKMIKQKLNSETWTNAFLTFASIFNSRHPSEAQCLLKYINTMFFFRSSHFLLWNKDYYL
jgi:hypothetical protein